MGLVVDTEWGVPIVHHGGSLFGYKSDWIIFPEQGVGAVILTNADAGGMLLRALRAPRRRGALRRPARGRGGPRLPRQDPRRPSSRKERERLVVPADPAARRRSSPPATRAPSSASLDGQEATGAATVFDFGEFTTAVASRKNDDGTISFITIDPGVVGLEFVVGERGGKRVLIVRDAQHEYVFTET